MKKLLLLIGLIATAAYGATTFTTNYQFNKPGDGDSNYGELIRDNWDSADTQLKTNADSITNHLNDTSGAHTATSISATSGSFLCPTQTTVQAYLDCLDGTFNPSTSGVVLITGTQTITGQKTFSSTPIFPSVANGILNTNGSGIISASSFSSLDPLTTKGDLLVQDASTSTRLGVGSDGQILVADSTASEGIAWENTNPRWRKFSYTYTDFSNASTSFSVTAFTLLSGEGIDAIVVKHGTPFTGGTITAYTLEIGETGDSDQFSTPFDVFQATSTSTLQVTNSLDVPNIGATTDVVVTAKSTGDNLDQATAGTVDIYFRTFLLP